MGVMRNMMKVGKKNQLVGWGHLYSLEANKDASMIVLSAFNVLRIVISESSLHPSCLNHVDNLDMVNVEQCCGKIQGKCPAGQ
jgi:hypothetical protein